MQNHFRLQVRDEDEGTVVLVLAGELDLASSQELIDALERLGGSRSIVLDMRELEFIDSSGLSVLVKAHQRAAAEGGELSIVRRDDSQVQRLLDLTGLTERLRVSDAPDELLAGG